MSSTIEKKKISRKKKDQDYNPYLEEEN